MPTEGQALQVAPLVIHQQQPCLLPPLAEVLGGLAHEAAVTHVVLVEAEGPVVTLVLAAQGVDAVLYQALLALAEVEVEAVTRLLALLVLVAEVELDFLVRAAMAQQEQVAAVAAVAVAVAQAAEWAALQVEKTAALADFTVAGLEREPLMAHQGPECLEQCV